MKRKVDKKKRTFFCKAFFEGRFFKGFPKENLCPFLSFLSVRTERDRLENLPGIPFPALFLKKKKAMGQVRKPWFDPKDPTIVRSGGSNHGSIQRIQQLFDPEDPTMVRSKGSNNCSTRRIQPCV